MLGIAPGHAPILPAGADAFNAFSRRYRVGAMTISGPYQLPFPSHPLPYPSRPALECAYASSAVLHPSTCPTRPLRPFTYRHRLPSRANRTAAPATIPTTTAITNPTIPTTIVRNQSANIILITVSITVLFFHRLFQPSAFGTIPIPDRHETINPQHFYRGFNSLTEC